MITAVVTFKLPQGMTREKWLEHIKPVSARFQNIPGLITLDRWMTPQNNLGVQTEVIRRASRFVGTCGSLAWLAPMLGTETLAVYADDHFLTSHLYAARHAYASMEAARFTTLDLALLDQIDVFDRAEGWVSRS